jgi:hypothetical protein
LILLVLHGYFRVYRPFHFGVLPVKGLQGHSVIESHKKYFLLSV